MSQCADCGIEKRNKKNPRCYSCAQKERFTRMPIHNKGKKRWWDSPTQWIKNDPRISGINAYQWKEDGYTTQSLHRWLKKHRGKATKCAFCGSEAFVQWANKSQKYIRDLDDWLQLCATCHKRYDNKMHKELGIKSFLKARFTNGR